MAGKEDQGFRYERIQNDSGVIMEKVTHGDGGKIMYCVVGPENAAGERPLMNLELIMHEEDTNAPWVIEICEAFEQTIRFDYCEPAAAPTATPTEAPTAEPTATPTEAPTAEPTAAPTEAPTAEPTTAPTEAPTAEPTAEPVAPAEDESGVNAWLGRKFVAVSYEVEGISLDASTLGSEFSIILNADHTAYVCLAGAKDKLHWTETAGGIEIDYYGAYTFPVSFSGDEMLLNYMDSLLLHMQEK